MVAPARPRRIAVSVLAFVALSALAGRVDAQAEGEGHEVLGGPDAITAPFDRDIERESAELERVRRELDQARQDRKTIAVRENKILGQLNSIDSDLALKERLISGLARKEDRLAADLERTRARLAQEEAKLAERRDVLRRRLRNIYKYGEKPGLQVLLGASSAVDLIRRFDWLLLVAAQDRRLVEDVRESVLKVHEVEQEAARKQAEVRAIRQESEGERAELAEKREERAGLLDSVRKEKKSREQVIAELEQAEKQVQQLITELEEKAKLALEGGLPPEGTGFEERRGKLPWPVAGKVERWFGVQKDKRFGTSTFNGGVDIKAERESDVVAVHRGRADYVNWLPGYGQCIIINHGAGYYTLYAHTSKVFVSAGDVVQTGQVIASVGDTGSMLGNVLHFEIRKDAEPINPAPWMVSSPLR
ncbi:MAG: peptidoglycan DD-metalloendopeptidase family protein [Gemmatimonadetes bacterium]|nr:peptidoglycan DD-metalloendopeptidase family protein [Gemmatimonadota bacterium]